MSDRLFTVAVVRPEQYSNLRDGQRCLGEKRLLGALLAVAFHELRHPDENLALRARGWFAYGDTGRFTCRDVCAYLTLDYSKIRKLALSGLKVSAHVGRNAGDRRTTGRWNAWRGGMDLPMRQP